MDYNTLASPEIVTRTAEALRANGVEAIVIERGTDALARIQALIPAGASIMNGSSRTLEQIGFVDYLASGKHPWNNLHTAILAEKDPAKKSALRKQSVLADFYLGSVHALAETGDFIIASNTGSQLAPIVYTARNLIFVVSTKKIVPTFADTFVRLEQYVVPLEDQRMMEAANVHTGISKIVVFKRERPKSGRTVTLILVNEDLGF